MMTKKTVMVTGASRGIGLEFTRRFLARGDDVIATQRKKSPGLSTLLKKYPKQLKVISLDVSKPDSIKKLKSQIRKTKYVDLLINNAGIADKSDQKIASIKVKNLKNIFDTNVIGPALVTGTLIPWLMKAQSPIVANISSLMGSISDNEQGGYYGYRISKASLNMQTKNLAIEYPQILSVVLHPGWVRTDMGGPNAHISVEESVEGMIRVIDQLTLSKSGGFFNYKGETLRW